MDVIAFCSLRALRELSRLLPAVHITHASSVREVMDLIAERQAPATVIVVPCEFEDDWPMVTLGDALSAARAARTAGVPSVIVGDLCGYGAQHADSLGEAAALAAD